MEWLRNLEMNGIPKQEREIEWSGVSSEQGEVSKPGQSVHNELDKSLVCSPARRDAGQEIF